MTQAPVPPEMMAPFPLAVVAPVDGWLAAGVPVKALYSETMFCSYAELRAPTPM